MAAILRSLLLSMALSLAANGECSTSAIDNHASTCFFVELSSQTLVTQQELSVFRRLSGSEDEYAVGRMVRRFRVELFLFGRAGLLPFADFDSAMAHMHVVNGQRKSALMTGDKRIFGPVEFTPETYIVQAMSNARYRFLDELLQGRIVAPPGLELPSAGEIRSEYESLLREDPALNIEVGVVEWLCASEKGVCLSHQKINLAVGHLRLALSGTNGMDSNVGKLMVSRFSYSTRTAAAAGIDEMRHRGVLGDRVVHLDIGGVTPAIRFDELGTAGVAIVLAKEPATPVPFSRVEPSIRRSLLARKLDEWIGRKTDDFNL